jgi:predicted amidohydrolase YtcJ
MKLLFNARIHTMNKSQPATSALVVDGERILAVGKQEELLREFDRAKRQDMGGKVILPGLTDSHIHLQDYALLLQKVDCETATKEECLRRIAERLPKLNPGSWLEGHGWNQNRWNPSLMERPTGVLREGAGAEGEWPSASDLDAVSANIPIYLTAKSMHAGWANRAALQRANISAGTPDPLNGQIQRDSHGQPTGILFENAMDLVEAAIPKPKVEEVAEAIRNVQPSLWRVGLTGLHDFDKRPCFMALQQLHAADELRLRVTKSIPIEDLPFAVGVGLRSGFGDNTLRLGSVKAFADGALGPRTAAMFDSYIDEPQNRGILTLDGEMLFEQGCLAAECGLSMAVHAIGDRATHEVLEGFARLRRYERENGLPPLRHRIEHVQLIHPDDAGRLAELGLVASMQPVHAPSDMDIAERYWGGRTALAYAWRTQTAHGARLAFGSDAPVEIPNPFLGLHAAVTRQRLDGSPGPDGWHGEQRLTLQEALEGFTLGPAYAAGMEDRLGQLAAGCLADLIVLDDDPFLCDPTNLHSLQPVATMVGGEWTWQEG